MPRGDQTSSLREGIMPTTIASDEVRQLVTEQGAQIVDALPRWEYDEKHLAQAISVPLKRLDRETAGRLNMDRPVVVYCHDHL